MAKAKVSITRCGSYGEGTVIKAIRDNIDALGGIRAFVKKDENILIKPNLLSGKPPEAAVTTHPEIVRAIISLVKEAGARPYVGDSPGLGTARKAARKMMIQPRRFGSATAGAGEGCISGWFIASLRSHSWPWAAKRQDPTAKSSWKVLPIPPL